MESWAVLLSLCGGSDSRGSATGTSQQFWAVSRASHRGFIRKHSPAKGAPAYKIGAAETAWDSLLRESREDEMSQEVLRAGIGAVLFGLGDMMSQVRSRTLCASVLSLVMFAAVWHLWQGCRIHQLHCCRPLACV